MCTGACVLYKVARVVIGENITFVGGEAYLKQRGIEVIVLQDKECETLMQAFIKEKPDVWLVLPLTLWVYEVDSVYSYVTGTKTLEFDHV